MSDIELRADMTALELAPSEAAMWQDLPPELLPRILARLPANEVPCTARLVCKAAAAVLSSPKHTTVRLSQPSPHGEFARRWGVPGAMRPLTLNRRRRLLNLTAASGCLRNLTWLTEHVGCIPDKRVLVAAAAAGRLEACRWLLQQGGEGGLEAALKAALAAAAGAGQRSTLEALLADPGAQSLPSHIRFGRDFRASLASCAAHSGHVGLMDWLLERFKLGQHDIADFLGAVAAGCDLPTLQRLHHLGCTPTANLQLVFGSVLSRAASSPTSDWKAKVEWTQTCLGAPLDTKACAKAAACPDALERLTWLRARGYPWKSGAVNAAAGAGNVEALSYLLAEGCEVHWSALRAAAAEGHLAALEVLHSHDLPGNNAMAWTSAARYAAREGHLPVVRWMLERQLIELRPPAPGDEYGTLMGLAAQSGSVELLAMLHAGGCPWDEGDLYAAAEGGSEEALELAVAQGCPVRESHDEVDDPYLIAAIQGDWATLACLRRLAVPWRPLDRGGGTFTDAVRGGCSVPILCRLLELGCPVDWRRAAEEADGRDQDVRAWLKEVEVAPQRL